MKGSEDPDHVMVALNIKYTPKAFRHRITNDLSDEESESIVRGSRGTNEEMQSLFPAPSPALPIKKDLPYGAGIVMEFSDQDGPPPGAYSPIVDFVKPRFTR